MASRFPACCTIQAAWRAPRCPSQLPKPEQRARSVARRTAASKCVLFLVHRRIVNPLHAVTGRLDVRGLLDDFDLHDSTLLLLSRAGGRMRQRYKRRIKALLVTRRRV